MRVACSIFVAVVLLTGGTTSADSITLAREGKATATIVIPAKPPQRHVQAAKDLQEYVKKICGVELPIRRDGKRVPGTGLYIGQCEPSVDADLPDASKNPESYAIRVRDGSVFFAARYPTPVYYAVASFIEDTLGVRWFAPGDVWEYVPPGRAGELTAIQRDKVKTPDVSPRFWSGHGWNEDWNRWTLRNKAVGGERAPRKNFQNHMHEVLPPEKYAASHPEYYPLIDGKRWIPPKGYRYFRPCESNPEVLRLTVEAARDHFDRHPDSDSFSLGMDDTAYLCGCENCRKLDAHPDSYEKREFSDRHYKFVNAVAKEIAKTHPGRYIGTLIYAIARKPPETVDRLEDNVFGYITEVCARWCEPGVREADQALTREWARRCRHLSRYDYFGLGTFTPRYYPHAMAEQIKFDESLGFDGMYAELNTFLPHTAPMIWAFAKLQWDASLDIDVLLNEYFTKMFGRSAPTMAKYFDLLERSWNSPPPERTDWEHRNVFIQAVAISPAAVDEGMALLAQAEDLAGEPIVRQRIATIRAALQYAGYAIKAYAQSEQIIKTPVSSAAQAASVMDLSMSLMQLSAEREPFWAAAMKRDDMLGVNIRGLNAKGYLMIGRIGNLERGSVIGSLRALDWYAGHDLAALAGAKQKLSGASRGGVADGVRAWLWVQDSKPQNLLQNGGFEQVVAVTRPAANTPDRMPVGWKTSDVVYRAHYELDPKSGRNDSAAALLSQIGSSVGYEQTCPVKPGERYAGIVYVRGRPDGRDAKGFLSLRFQKPDGGWHPRSDLEPQMYMVAQSQWQPLVVVATVPEGATRMVFIAGAKELPDGVFAVFDDAALYRLPAGF